MLSESEISVLAAHESSLNNIRAYLFYVSPETFHAYCNILLRNKSGKAGFSSRKLFREHCVDLFKSIATHGVLKNPLVSEAMAQSFSHSTEDRVHLNAAEERYASQFLLHCTYLPFLPTTPLQPYNPNPNPKFCTEWLFTSSTQSSATTSSATDCEVSRIAGLRTI